MIYNQQKIPGGIFHLGFLSVNMKFLVLRIPHNMHLHCLMDNHVNTVTLADIQL
jgi:hypothetical protein